MRSMYTKRALALFVIRYIHLFLSRRPDTAPLVSSTLRQKPWRRTRFCYYRAPPLFFRSICTHPSYTLPPAWVPRNKKDCFWARWHISYPPLFSNKADSCPLPTTPDDEILVCGILCLKGSFCDDPSYRLRVPHTIQDTSRLYAPRPRHPH